jgi:hypothetical protein
MSRLEGGVCTRSSFSSIVRRARLMAGAVREIGTVVVFRRRDGPWVEAARVAVAPAFGAARLVRRLTGAAVGADDFRGVMAVRAVDVRAVALRAVVLRAAAFRAAPFRAAAFRAAPFRAAPFRVVALRAAGFRAVLRLTVRARPVLRPAADDLFRAPVFPAALFREAPFREARFREAPARRVLFRAVLRVPAAALAVFVRRLAVFRRVPAALRFAITFFLSQPPCGPYVTLTVTGK